MKLAPNPKPRVQVRVIGFDEDGKLMGGSKAFNVYESTVDAVADFIRHAIELADVPDGSSLDA